MWKSLIVWAQDCFLPFHQCRGLFPVPFFQSQFFFTCADPKRVFCPSPNVVKLLHHWGKRRELSSHGFVLFLHRYCFLFQDLYHLRKLPLLPIHPPMLFVIIWLGLGRRVCNLLPTLLCLPFQEVLQFHASSHSDVSNSSNILSWPHFLACYLPSASKPIFMSCLLEELSFSQISGYLFILHLQFFDRFIKNYDFIDCSTFFLIVRVATVSSLVFYTLSRSKNVNGFLVQF